MTTITLGLPGPESAGARSLSLFLVPLRLPLIPPTPSTSSPSSILASDHTLPSSITRPSRQLQSNNNVLIHRLKNKIGTWPLPTAELSLNNTVAYRVGQMNQGVKTIAPVLNITRMHSAIDSLSYLARCLQIAKSYAGVRIISGSGGSSGQTLLKDLPLHTHTLAKVSVLYRALMHLTFGTVVLLGRAEYYTSPLSSTKNGAKEKENMEKEAAILRLLTPLVKGYVASYAVGGMEECMIALGGQGYMEENGIGRYVFSVITSRTHVSEKLMIISCLRINPFALQNDSGWAGGEDMGRDAKYNGTRCVARMSWWAVRQSVRGCTSYIIAHLSLVILGQLTLHFVRIK